MVRVLEVKKFVNAGGSTITCDPAFEGLEVTFDEPILDAASP